MGSAHGVSFGFGHCKGPKYHDHGLDGDDKAPLRRMLSPKNPQIPNPTIHPTRERDEHDECDECGECGDDDDDDDDGDDDDDDRNHKPYSLKPYSL